jgi:hypothetical protein
VLFKKVQETGILKLIDVEWEKFRTGSKRVIYSANYHPLWEYFTNLMLTFDAKKRPAFQEVLNILKKVEGKMKT